MNFFLKGGDIFYYAHESKVYLFLDALLKPFQNINHIFGRSTEALIQKLQTLMNPLLKIIAFYELESQPLAVCLPILHDRLHEPITIALNSQKEANMLLISKIIHHRGDRIARFVELKALLDILFHNQIPMMHNLFSEL